jgi:hypothetical protein
MNAKFAIILAAAGLLLAIVEPGAAASRGRRPADAYASGAVTHERVTQKPADVSSGWSSSDTRFPATSTADEPLGPGRNLPYPDRPYGDPDRW